MPVESTPSNRKLVIAFDAKRLFNNFTGLGNYSRTLVKNLQEAFPEHEYHLFTPNWKKNEETNYFFDESRFTIHTPKGIQPLWRSFGMANQVNALQPDIFHGLSHEIPFGLSRNIVSVITFHDLIYERYPLQFGWWDRKMYQWKYKSAALRCRHIIAISEHTKQDLVDIYGLDASKIEVIYQSCQDVFKNSEINESQLPSEIFGIPAYYLYVGSIIERKGLLTCVMAFAKLPEQYRKPFVVVGKGDAEYITKVREMITYYELEDYFYFINGVRNQDLVAVYDQSFCLIYPSIYEGFGIPVIESLFRSRPVITSDLTSLPEAAGPGAILVNPFSPDDIAQAMIWMHDAGIYEKLQTKGSDYVKDRFSNATTAKDLMNYYLDLKS